MGEEEDDTLIAIVMQRPPQHATSPLQRERAG